MRNKIIIGSRGSKLAMIQAASVAEQLKVARPKLHIEIHKIVTEGDRNRSISINEAGDMGIFVKALEDALLDGSIDIAVHSLKDLPTALPEGLCLLAATQRLDPRDALVSYVPLREMKPGNRIGTGSLRRSVQLINLRNDLEVCNIRGNVDSRLRKVASGEFDGIIIAAAAMLRLGWAAKITEYLPLDSFLPAVGQGALAIESRSDDHVIEDLTAALNHLPTWQAITAERAFLHSVGGGCRAPIAALATIDNKSLKMTAMVSDKAGKKILKDSTESKIAYPEQAGINLARKMLNAGAAEILKDIRCQ